uniref:RNA-directed DNA polymerase n=1 Tax=Steinernema glaseri TaxID=37863 RepID=A0A1I8AFL5_9BILA
MDKCSFGMEKIKFLGFIISKEGRRPDPVKTRAISEMPEPKNPSELRAFLGMINYYGSFVSQLHGYRAPLEGLLKKDTTWYWTLEQSEAVKTIKDILLSDLLLTHYDPNEEIVVAADASQYGIGCVILHRYKDGSTKAVEHASRTLTAAEKNYSQIEKEALGLIYAVKKFHRMIFGRRFTLLTDHKPLLSVFGSKNGIPTYTAARLQRWATILLGYDFAIEYRKTTAFGQADALSRLIAERQEEDAEETVIASLTLVQDLHGMDRLPIRLEDIKRHAKTDADITMVKGNMECLEKLRHGPLRCYWLLRDVISVMDDCLLVADRVVIPKKLQLQLLKQLHRGHPGMDRMKRLARKLVYWPKLDDDI